MTFDPRRHLIKVSGKEYMPVAARLIWLHEKHPDASIETEIVRIDDKSVVMRAVITIPREDGTSATYSGYKSAPFGGKFPPYEKAETGSIGRALAHAGLGTQFAGEDVEEGIDEGQLADSPQSRPAPDIRPHEPAVPAQAHPQLAADMNFATPNQLKRMYATGKGAGWTEDEMKSAMRERFGKESSKELTVTEASQLIDLFENGPVPSEGQQPLVTVG